MPSQKTKNNQTTVPFWISSFGHQGREGLYICRFNITEGRLAAPAHRVAEGISPLFITLHPNGRFLYAVGSASPADCHRGLIWAFSICPQTSALCLQQQLETGGAIPCFICADQTGQCLMVANYASGAVATFAVGLDGSLSPIVSKIAHTGRSIHPERQEASHPHAIIPSLDNAFAFAADLGADRIWVYRLDAARAELTFQEALSAPLPAGSGPRHLVFHPSGKFLYVVNELANTVSVFAYEPSAGRLTYLQTIGALPTGYHQTSYAAEIQIHPSGRFLYVSNRGNDSIAIFSVEPLTGLLTLKHILPVGGQWPRCFAIDPTGRWLLVACERSDKLAVFECDAHKGLLPLTDKGLAMPSPGSLAFLPQMV